MPGSPPTATRQRVLSARADVGASIQEEHPLNAAVHPFPTADTPAEDSPSVSPQSTSSDPPIGRGGGPHLDRRRFLQWTGAVGASLGVVPAARAADAAFGATTLTPEQEASRFLTQCTFGGDRALIDAMVSRGLSGWLDDQMALPVQLTAPQVSQYIDDLGDEEAGAYFHWVLWQTLMTAPDLVRQRVVFALSQIFVISQQVELIGDLGEGTATYHDLLARHAFGNFRDLLRDVALQPCMGLYLSHVNNRRSDPSLNRFPDENFARELMQLFSIGLFELNPDGSQKLDGQGQPIPTYGNAEITEMAKIFTGLTYAPFDPNDPVIFDGDPNLVDDMVMFEMEHEPGPKTLIGGVVVPAGQTGMQDIEAAIDVLFQHPNVGPFIGRQLIQRLVTSNPTPQYIARVSAAFDDNGQGVRGDMSAVLRTILMDSEARDPSRIDDSTFGKVREPFVRYVQLGRAFHATSASGLFRHFGPYLEMSEYGMFAQSPYYAPSVFNFYLPTHQPAGPIGDAGLVAPEMEIIHSVTAITGMNKYNEAVVHGFYVADLEAEVGLALGPEIALANQDPGLLLDHLDLLLTYGTLSSFTRQTLLSAILPLDDPMDQTTLALYLMSTCPEYAVQR